MAEIIQAVNPKTKEQLEQKFKISSKSEVTDVAESAYEAWKIFKSASGNEKATFLRTIATNIENLGDALVDIATAESGLPAGRIQGERGRTCGQLRLFADLVEEGSWVDAIIDEAMPDRKPMPRVDIRKMSEALGPVAVFGASNFPLAFSTAGGDTTSALAAGCPVIVKGHPSHPGTHALISKAISDAVESCDLPTGVYSSLHGGAEVGQQLVSHARVKAVGFTGSQGGGIAIMKAAQEREVPIPVYAEMGSINPICILPSMLEGDLSALAIKLANSINMGAGQFCTNPGVMLLPKTDKTDDLIQELALAFGELEAQTMLNEGIFKNYQRCKVKAVGHEQVSKEFILESEEEWKGYPAFATVSAKSFIENSDLHHEVFGPFSLGIVCDGKGDMISVISAIQGQLTGTLMGSDEDLISHKELVDALSEKVGRLIYNGVPTGVEVCHAMHHGGPYPAASSGKYTSVGTDAIRRFVRSISFQNAPQQLLPPALKDGNPLGIWRKVNGEIGKI